MAEEHAPEQATLVFEASPVNVELDSRTLLDASFNGRYASGYVIGRGGMGEVRLCRDQRIGRDVALKSILKEAQSPTLEYRFLREARVQAQLEHPSIVPVYDMGLTPEGQLFFTMKRVRGLGLDAIVRGLALGDPSLTDKFSLRRTLAAFNQACLAVDFAHRHGVIHRDLKPENIMVGDFGEVYVLDWGLAKVTAGDVSPLSRAATSTTKGTVMGTPGYMAPEQIVAPEEVDPRTDVFALGSVLFELLTLEPLVLQQTGKPQDAFRATLAGPDARASLRAPSRNLPPELDAICVKATAPAPEQRYQSARELSEALERFLDGERDVELRRALAERHARQAWAVVSQSGLRAAERLSAMAEIGRALALDPGNADAMRALVQLLQTPMTDVPAEVEREVTERENRTLRLVRRSGTLAYASFLLFLPLLVWMGVRDWVWVGCMMALAATATMLSVFARSDRWFTPMFYGTLVVSTLAIACVARMFGPFVVCSSVAAVNVLGLCLIRPRKGAPWPLLASVGSTAVLLPAFLESMGWLSPSYVFDGGTLTIVPHMVELARVPTSVVLLLLNLTVIGFPAAVFGLTRSALDRAELELRVQAWHLRALAPAATSDR